jgi:hypothetical protein
VRNYTRDTEVVPIANLNISEPDTGYTAPAGFALAPANYKDGNWGNLTELAYVNNDGKIPDEPFDETGNGNGGTARFNRRNENKNCYRYAHLQRLANPLVGWNPASNPYRTVDTLPIDLQVFNGEATSSGSAVSDPPNAPGGGGGGAGGGPGGGAGGGGAGGGGANPQPYVGTRERGEVDAQSNNPRRLLWRQEPETRLTQQSSVSPGDQHFFSYHFEEQNQQRETLGETLFENDYSTIINDSFDYRTNPAYGNQPVEFPSLHWNNRPFVSQYELMLVPQTRSSQLLRRFSLGDQDNYAQPNRADGRFGHLMNFFKTTKGGRQGANLYQLFDYLHVPSRFAHSSGILQPDLFSASGYAGQFRAPYNVLPSLREPGKINLNTITHEAVLNGLKGGAFGKGGHHGDFDWFNFVASRRGHPLDPGTTGNVFDPSPKRSYVANSFRSGSDGNLVTPGETVRAGVEASFLRSEDPTAAQPATSLMDNRQNLSSPALGENSLHGPGRHAYLRYRNRVRLGNLATTRSNVFAVWITVGYFEYDEDTEEFGSELGKETGNVKRHRAFYMLDRSIPVGFEPGKNHNVDKAIMLRRYIE